PTWVLVLIGLIMGYFVVAAEPAVFVLKEQVEEVTEGSISAKAMGLGLSLGVGVSVALSMIRVITGISILYFVIPGYLIALILTFIVPPLFTSIAFDSGAVASGPLAATFLLPFAIGASEALGGNIYSDAFGIVALIAMTPVITLQLFGLTYVIKLRKIQNQNPLPVGDDNIIYYDDEDIEEDVSSDNVEERVDVNDINRYNSTKDDAHTKNIEAEV
ncbi:DUF1538 domain-containing protein, partial [Herbinix luporum]